MSCVGCVTCSLHSSVNEDLSFLGCDVVLLSEGSKYYVFQVRAVNHQVTTLYPRKSEYPAIQVLKYCPKTNPVSPDPTSYHHHHLLHIIILN